MRVMVTIEGKVSVHEILEFEPQEDGSILMTTAADCVDLVVTNMNETRMEAVMNELLKLGYSNITEYETIYDKVFENDEDDDMETFSAVCPVCNQAFEFEMTPQAAALGVIICPRCGEELEFDAYEDDNMLRLVHADAEEEDNEDALMRMQRAIVQMGLEDALRAKGVEPGDTVCILDVEFEYAE